MNDNDTRLRAVELSITQLCTEVRIYTQATQKIIERHDESINGKDGLKIKVDRLDQSEKHRKWSIRSLWALTSAAVVKHLYSDFF